MSLQVRLIHSLGDRLLDLNPPADGQPLVVGRSGDAFISVPAVNISRKHCLLYVHEGKWVIADAGSAAGTFVNGERLTEPAYLNLGDTVTLGTDPNPPRLIVDPMGVAQRSAARTGRTAAVEMPVEEPAAEAWPVPVAARPALAPSPRTGPVAMYAGGSSIPAAPQEDYPAPVSGPYAAAPLESPVESAPVWPGAGHAHASHRPAKSGSGGMAAAIIAIVVVVGLAIAGIVAAVHHRDQQPESIVAKPVAPPPQEQQPKSKEVFFGLGTGENSTPGADANSTPAVTAGARTATPAAPTAPTPPTAPPSTALVDPNVSADEWQQVTNAHDINAWDNPESAILVYNDFLTQHPNSKQTPTVRAFIDEALDRLWWLHIDVLCEQREDLRAQLKTTKDEITQETDAEFKKKLLADKQTLSDQISAVEKELADLYYTDPTRPSLTSAEVVSALRQKRNPAAFERFKKDSFNVIKRTRSPMSWHTTR